MTKYRLYIRIRLPQLHLVFFGKRCLRLVLWLRKHTHSDLLVQEELPWEELR